MSVNVDQNDGKMFRQSELRSWGQAAERTARPVGFVGFDGLRTAWASWKSCDVRGPGWNCGRARS